MVSPRDTVARQDTAPPAAFEAVAGWWWWWTLLRRLRAHFLVLDRVVP